MCFYSAELCKNNGVYTGKIMLIDETFLFSLKMNAVPYILLSQYRFNSEAIFEFTLCLIPPDISRK